MKIFLAYILFLCPVTVAQNLSAAIHSYNDYVREAPFEAAYNSGAASVEVDVFLKKDTLYVTHAESEIITGN